MLWAQIGRAILTVLTSGGVGGGASAVVSDDPTVIAVSGIVTGVVALVALFMRSPQTPKAN